LEGFEIPITSELIIERSREQLEGIYKTTLMPVINATGVILHTNLGRAPLSQDAIDAMQIIGTSYSTLEFDLYTGKRGSRSMHVEQILCHLTGAESAFIVNNNASGIIEAITSADLIFPSKRMTVINTINAPRIRFSTTVNEVFAISSPLSITGLINTPSGRLPCISSTLFLTSRITSFEFAFLSIII